MSSVTTPRLLIRATSPTPPELIAVLKPINRHPKRTALPA